MHKIKTGISILAFIFVIIGSAFTCVPPQSQTYNLEDLKEAYVSCDVLVDVVAVDSFSFVVSALFDGSASILSSAIAIDEGCFSGSDFNTHFGFSVFAIPKVGRFGYVIDPKGISKFFRRSRDGLNPRLSIS